MRGNLYIPDHGAIGAARPLHLTRQGEPDRIFQIMPRAIPKAGPERGEIEDARSNAFGLAAPHFGEQHIIFLKPRRKIHFGIFRLTQPHAGAARQFRQYLLLIAQGFAIGNLAPSLILGVHGYDIAAVDIKNQPLILGHLPVSCHAECIAKIRVRTPPIRVEHPAIIDIISPILEGIIHHHSNERCHSDFKVQFTAFRQQRGVELILLCFHGIVRISQLNGGAQFHKFRNRHVVLHAERGYHWKLRTVFRHLAVPVGHQITGARSGCPHIAIAHTLGEKQGGRQRAQIKRVIFLRFPLVRIPLRAIGQAIIKICTVGRIIPEIIIPRGLQPHRPGIAHSQGLRMACATNRKPCQKDHPDLPQKNTPHTGASLQP